MTDVGDHGRLMDDVYRYQRVIYDVTRKYFLLGRDHMIDHMIVRPGDTVLEVACGTGRNLALIRARYPRARLYGLDISEHMLASARSKLGSDAALARADACHFDPGALFGVASFDHIVISYSLSMIPDWQAALAEAMRRLSPGGHLHVVDFGDQAGLPRWFKHGLRRWLSRFHVSVRDSLPGALQQLAQVQCVAGGAHLYRGYAFYGRLERCA